MYRIQEQLRKTLTELTWSLDAVNQVFGKILERLYMEQESDILSDIEEMKTMMNGEELVLSMAADCGDKADDKWNL